MAFMRSQGLIAEPRFCRNGSAFADWNRMSVNTDTPMWLVGGVEGLGSTLVNASTMARTQMVTKVNSSRDRPPLQCCGQLLASVVPAVEGQHCSNSILIMTPTRACPGPQRPVPGVMFFNATTALPDASSNGGFGTLQLDGALLLCATIFNTTLAFGTRPALDFTNRTTPLWNASATGQVMVLNLVRLDEGWCRAVQTPQGVRT